MRWWVGIAVGCGAATEDETPCAELAAAECGARSDCAAVNGAPVSFETTASGSCYVPGTDAEFVSCRENTGECPPVVRFAAPAEGEDCWQFAAGCAPDGWVACDEVGPCAL